MSRNGEGMLRAGCRLAASVILCAVLGACSMPLADLPSPIGLPAGAPARPETPAAFPAVHDMPPPRAETLLEPEEQQRIQRELERARDRQESRAGIGRNAAEQK